MRTVFLLLLLANVAFFAYGRTALERAPASDAISSIEVNRDKIRIIRPSGKTPAAPTDASGVSKVVAEVACIEWGAVAGPAVSRADAAIAALNLPDASVQRTVLDAGGYWVYLPPAKSKAELERNLAGLGTAGITDYFVVQESPAWRHAVSLGIFKSEEAAASFLQALRAQGVKTAVVGRRENFLKQIAYFVREPDAATVARLAKLQREFPGTQIKAVACPR